MLLESPTFLESYKDLYNKKNDLKKKRDISMINIWRNKMKYLLHIYNNDTIKFDIPFMESKIPEFDLEELECVTDFKSYQHLFPELKFKINPICYLDVINENIKLVEDIDAQLNV